LKPSIKSLRIYSTILCINGNFVVMPFYFNEILKVLIYFDIFQYPLTENEIYERTTLTIDEVRAGLEYWQTKEKVFLVEGYFTLHNDNTFVNLRKKRNKLATKYHSKAQFISKIVSKFPFIRGIFLSGSISKNCMDENSDIDFFIITAPNRLWIARLFCYLFQKIFLLNSSKYFCYNYIIDNKHLKFDDHSYFIAIEIMSLIPLYGKDSYHAIHQQNTWIKKLFPNFVAQTPTHLPSKNFIQNCLEKIFDNHLGDHLDSWLLKKAIEKNQKRHSSKILTNPRFYLNFQKHIAKAHTSDNYPNTLMIFQKKMEEYNL
jgi:hypothetical protein